MNKYSQMFWPNTTNHSSLSYLTHKRRHIIFLIKDTLQENISRPSMSWKINPIAVLTNDNQLVSIMRSSHQARIRFHLPTSEDSWMPNLCTPIKSPFYLTKKKENHPWFHELKQLLEPCNYNSNATRGNLKPTVPLPWQGRTQHSQASLLNSQRPIDRCLPLP